VVFVAVPNSFAPQPQYTRLHLARVEFPRNPSPNCERSRGTEIAQNREAWLVDAVIACLELLRIQKSCRFGEEKTIKSARGCERYCL
jgi:hypothetical protein